MDRRLCELVVNNPYLIDQIMAGLDIRSLFSCFSVSKEFFDAAFVEYERRKEIIHLYLLNYNQYNEINCKDVQNLFISFRNFTKLWLNMRPKEVFLMIGGYRQSTIDYRRRDNFLSVLSEFLPKDCHVIYVDVGPTVLTSSIRFKSLTNYGEEQSNSQISHRTAFPCMSCLLIPDIDGVQIRTYTDIESVKTNEVKTILLFISSKKLSRMTLSEKRHEMTNTLRDMNRLITRCGYGVAFGGGSVKASKSVQKCDPEEVNVSKHLIITFGGQRVRTASYVIRTTDSYLHQLLDLKIGLDFDCDDWQNSITIAYIFANNDNFSQHFTSAFQTVFPFVGIFGFQTNDRMYGKHFKTSDTSDRNRVYSVISSTNNSVVVLLNIESKKYKKFI